MTANNRHVNAIRHVIEIIGLVGFIGNGFGVGVELENDRWRENRAYNLILFNALTFLTFSFYVRYNRDITSTRTFKSFGVALA